MFSLLSKLEEEKNNFYKFKAVSLITQIKRIKMQI